MLACLHPCEACMLHQCWALIISYDRHAILTADHPAPQGDLNLNIAEAHAFNTTDKFSLDVFVVNGWPGQVHTVGWLRSFTSFALMRSATAASAQLLCTSACFGRRMYVPPVRAALLSRPADESPLDPRAPRIWRRC